jgi:CAAX protease family protein
MKILQNEKSLLIIELLLVAVIFYLINHLFGTIKYSGQIAEIISLVLISYFLYKRKSSWKDLGFKIPKKWPMAILHAILCIASIALVFNFIIQPLFPHGANDINQGIAISQNEMIFQLVFIAIGTAAIGEEMLMRGFVLNNLNKIFGENFIGMAGAVLLQAILFGLLHSGTQGMISSGVIGLILGIFYIVSGRNLLVVMVAHAIPDILSIISSYQVQ